MFNARSGGHPPDLNAEKLLVRHHAPRLDELMPRAPRIGDWISLLALTVFWGTSFMLNEIALASLPPAILIAGRLIVAALVLGVFLRSIGQRLPPLGRAWLPMLVMAVFGNVLPFHAIAWAQQHIDSSLAGVLMAVMPLFVLPLAHFFIPGARLTPYRIAGFVAGFAGVVMILGPGIGTGLGGDVALWGALAVLGAALSYSVSTIYARRLTASDPVRMAGGMLLVASALSLPAAALDFTDLALPSVSALAATVVLGLLSTGFATILYFRVVQGPGPAFLSLISYLVPAWAVVAGALFLDETISTPVYLGLALILSGIALSELGAPFARAVKTSARRRAAPVVARAASDARVGS